MTRIVVISEDELHGMFARLEERISDLQRSIEDINGTQSQQCYTLNKARTIAACGYATIRKAIESGELQLNALGKITHESFTKWIKEQKL